MAVCFKQGWATGLRPQLSLRGVNFQISLNYCFIVSFLLAGRPFELFNGHWRDFYRIQWQTYVFSLPGNKNSNEGFQLQLSLQQRGQRQIVNKYTELSEPLSSLT